MAWVNRLVTEAAPGEDRPDRRAEAQKCSNLVGGGVGPEDQVVLQPEGILHVTRRVIVRDIQRLETKILRLDLGPGQYRKPHPLKDILQFHLGERDRMQRSKAASGPGSGKVQRGCLLVWRRGAGLLTCLLNGLGGEIFQLVEPDPELLFLFGRKTAKVGPFGQRGDTPLAAEVMDTDLLNIGRALGIG